MRNIVEQGLYYDFYGALLTDHQKQIYEDAIFQDMSLSEIAESYGISRQAAHDLIKRCDKLLAGYEEKLHLVEKFGKARDTITQIDALSQVQDELTAGQLRKKVQEIQTLANELLQNF